MSQKIRNDDSGEKMGMRKHSSIFTQIPETHNIWVLKMAIKTDKRMVKFPDHKKVSVYFDTEFVGFTRNYKKLINKYKKYCYRINFDDKILMFWM